MIKPKKIKVNHEGTDFLFHFSNGPIKENSTYYEITLHLPTGEQTYKVKYNPTEAPPNETQPERNYFIKSHEGWVEAEREPKKAFRKYLNPIIKIRLSNEEEVHGYIVTEFEPGHSPSYFFTNEIGKKEHEIKYAEVDQDGKIIETDGRGM
jgi:hypothetical protein